MKRLKKTMLLMLMLVFTLGMAIPVHAETATRTLFLYPIKGSSNTQLLRVELGKITNLKSSNKSVASVTTKTVTYKWSESKYTGIYAKLKKLGTTTISYKYKENGKTKTYKVKLKVQKYINLIASVKIGNTTIKGSKFKNTSEYTVKYSKFVNKTVNVKVTPIKGWRVVNPIGTGAYLQILTDATRDTSDDVVYNGKSVKVKGKGFDILCCMVNDKLKQRKSFTIHFR